MVSFVQNEKLSLLWREVVKDLPAVRTLDGRNVLGRQTLHGLTENSVVDVLHELSLKIRTDKIRIFAKDKHYC